MIYWHLAVLILVLSDGREISIDIPFKDEMSCGQALLLLVEAARIDYPESYATCVSTGVPSGVVVRPEARP